MNGSFTGNATNALKGSVTSELVIGSSFLSGSQFLYFDQTASTGNNFLKEFTLRSNASIGNELKIATGSTNGFVSLATSGITLNTNDLLTLTSTSFGTARIAALPVNSSGVATSFIHGKVKIERYIPAGRGWRLLSAPVKTAGAPTINEAWQEGLTTASANPNLYPGYGVKICGGSSVNGYDTSATLNTFIKVYNSVTNSFAALPANPGTNISISSYPAYFLYIRGDRSVNMLQGLSAAITSTTLRTKGEIITGKQEVTVNGSNFTLLGNPYPAAIDFHSLTKNNVADAFYAWDPKLAGNYGVGGYVTGSWNNSTSTYDLTGSVSNITQYIQSGNAVFVASADHTNPGTISIRETDKTDLGCDPVSRSAGLGKKMRVNLLQVNNDSSSSLLDGVLTTYDDANSNDVDVNDAKKLYGSNQSINIKRNNSTLAIERRHTVTDTDTCFLNLYQMKVGTYSLEITLENLDNNALMAILKDNFSGSSNNLPLNMNGKINVAFSVNSNPGSYATDRFSIIFEKLAALPVTFKTIKAFQQEENISVEWHTENEIDLHHYDVERSADGRNYFIMNIHAADGIAGVATGYTWLDKKPLTGINYYRIVSVSANNIKQYSSIARVTINDKDNVPEIIIFPNPVTGNTVHLKASNIESGNYKIQFFSTGGQMVSSSFIQYDNMNNSGTINFRVSLPTGKYQLIFTGENTNISMQLIKK